MITCDRRVELGVHMASVALVCKFRGAMFVVRLVLLLVLLLFNYSIAEHEIGCSEKERLALLDLKGGLVMNGPDLLSSWITEDDHNSSDCCHWEGVTCSNSTGHVEMLDLNRKNQLPHFGGEIRASLMELQHLLYLNLSYNKFRNTPIPEFFGSLENLRFLDLKSSAFGGRIPKDVGNLSHLQYLDLSWNHLEGTIPPQLGNLSHLQYLHLGFNQFTHIPEFFGSLSNLRFLDLSYSFSGGRIPIGLSRLSHLQYLDLSLNNLEGTIPHQLGNLTHLQYLDLNFNYDLVGTIPYELGSLSNLQQLKLGHCRGLKIHDKNHGGEWLSNLTLLTHLDLSQVQNLNYSHSWLQRIAMVPKLEQLKLYHCDLSDHHLYLFPSMFNFSTSLSILDLSFNTFTSSKIFQWVFNATSNLTELDLSFNFFEGPISYDFSNIRNPLKHLDLSNNILQGEILKSFGDICTLHSLLLDSTNLKEDISTFFLNLSGCARYSLSEISLAGNQITGTLLDLSIFPSLKALDLSFNQLNGKVSESDKLPSKLESLTIRSNSLEGGIPESFGNICTLRSLDLSNNSLIEELSVITHILSIGCAKHSLQQLILARNRITGTIPDLSILPSLEMLDLSDNLLNGKIPENIQFPSQLVFLHMQSNKLEGVIGDSHFAKTSMLQDLDFSYNSLALIFSENWVPPFQLDFLHLSSCRLGPDFPKWLQTQKQLVELDISNAGISDVVPVWFWAQMTNLWLMNISFNSLTGTIPNLPVRFLYPCDVFLTSNRFEGPIPLFLQSAGSLLLSKNKFSKAHVFLCTNTTIDRLLILDLSENQLLGQLLDCWNHFKALQILDLSGNSLSGEGPSSMGSLLALQVLILRNNSLTGKLPLSLKNCTNLVVLDLGENRLSGPIPSWIGSGQQLQMLSLRKNQFSGSLPQNLCYLTKIQLLDLSINNLSGHIFKCLKNFTAMSQKVDFSSRVVGITYGSSYKSIMLSSHFFYDLFTLLMWKGREQLFNNNKFILKTIDLSSNKLTGDIPEEIGNLVELVSLNLSRNCLSGKITSKIGRLTSLDFLDLSRNQFFGSIPPTLAQIDRLSVFDISYNNLSGRIPIGTQLQSFNASSYEGNLDLCGKPLDTMCPGDEAPPQEPKTLDKSSLKDKNPIFLSMALGFITGFWGLLGSLLLNRTWRHAYFSFLNKMIDTIYVATVVNGTKFQRWLKGLLVAE